ncbi:2OG-Fe(II) oxygenase [Bradyrhizobium sp.]
MSSRDDLIRTGAVVFDETNRPYSVGEIAEIIDLCNALPTAKGIGENNLVQCGRILIDPVDIALIANPDSDRRVLDQVSADRILSILQKAEAIQRFREMLDAPYIVIRRAQTNILSAGGYIGLHTDSESNPEYLANVVVGLTDAYRGGDYVIHRGSQPQAFRLRRGTLLISLNNVPHEVTLVTSGLRCTLAFFLSGKDAPSRA